MFKGVEFETFIL